MKLVLESGTVPTVGTMLHMVKGPSIGQCWRYEGVAERHTGDHHVRCSRSHPNMGRVQKDFHPSLFGGAVVVDVHLYADRERLARWVRESATQIVLLTIGGFIAWYIATLMDH